MNPGTIKISRKKEIIAIDRSKSEKWGQELGYKTLLLVILKNYRLIELEKIEKEKQKI